MSHAYLRAGTAAKAFFCSKTPWATRHQARRALQRMSNLADRPVAFSPGTKRAYECAACGLWHIGSPMKKKGSQR